MATIPIVNTVDKRVGIITAIIAMVLIILYLLLTTIALADPPPPDPVVMAETEIPEELQFKVIEMSGGADAGSPTDDVVKPPAPQTEPAQTPMGPGLPLPALLVWSRPQGSTALR